ncbi:hypothetical protein OIU76_026568 [Salix suchowensis]|nr:hypothetical protein OIU76_026568 [Salix suchowensis]
MAENVRGVATKAASGVANKVASAMVDGVVDTMPWEWCGKQRALVHNASPKAVNGMASKVDSVVGMGEGSRPMIDGLMILRLLGQKLWLRLNPLLKPMDPSYQSCIMMIVHCWNVRGLNSPLKQHEVVNLMKKKKIDVCGLLENKMSSSKVEAMQKLRSKHSGNSRLMRTCLPQPRIVVFSEPASSLLVDLVDRFFPRYPCHSLPPCQPYRSHVSFVYGLAHYCC